MQLTVKRKMVPMTKGMKKNIAALFVFAVSFAFVESSVVVYLRALYYPEGFSFPLKMMPPDHLPVEVAREGATIVMLVAAGMLAGERRREKFGCFLFAFGVWDIFYYVWLNVMLDWPVSVFDWDILFLIPIPWIGPVIAPVLISLLFIAASILILKQDKEGFHPSMTAWIFAAAGSGSILYSFMCDTDATTRLAMPQPYGYGWLAAGLIFYGISLFVSLRSRTG